MKKIKPVITLGILSMILTVGISVQLKTIKAADISGTIQLTDSNLKKSLLQTKTNYEDSVKKLADTDKELENLRNNVLNIESDVETQEKIKKYEIILGLTKVQGEGVTITVADNNEQKDNSSFASINNSNYLVHDGNLVAIQINGEKVGSPFVINAIGDKDLLYGELTKNGGTLYKLKKYGVLTSIKKVDSIEIDKEI